MKLLIISNMSHYLRDNEIVGWGPTVQEISHLAELFDDVRHVACLHPEAAPASALPYTSQKVHLVPVAPAGGEHLKDKLKIVTLIPQYVRTILRELRRADVVHVRCPANISMIAIILLALVRKPRLRWVKYAGNWRPDAPEARSYTFQRWWLQKGFSRGEVTVNGNWPDQPSFVHSFYNPCLTEEELGEARCAANSKRLDNPLRLLYVGRLEKPKGVHTALSILAALREKGVAATLDLVGDGPYRASRV